MENKQPIHDESIASGEVEDSREWAFALIHPKHKLRWWVLFCGCVFLILLLAGSLLYMTSTGVGVLGVHNGVPWGWDIMNFIFWIGIAHAGTLISAILLLSRQVWRRSVSRLAELITLCAVLCASIYPLFHIGRVWMAWFFVPVPESNAMWQNFLSPLMWDAFAVGTYACVSLIFFYVSLIPDLGLMKKMALTNRARTFYHLLSLGWTGDLHQEILYKRVCWLLALILTPLVISVHSIVSYDFAVTVVPGWQVSVFPPYFVAGAILSGLGMVMVVVLPLRRFFGWGTYIGMNDLSSMAKLMAAVACLLGSFYFSEMILTPDDHGLSGRYTFEYGILFGMMILTNVVLPQLFWKESLRQSTAVLFLTSLGVLIGMWVERYLIVVGSAERSFLPASWTDYAPTVVDGAMLVGTLGLFIGLILLGMRFFPLVNMHELSEGDDDHVSLEGRSESALRNEINNERLRISHDALGYLYPHRGMGGWAMLGALIGFLSGLALLYFTQIVDYPMVLQGRGASLVRFIGFAPVLLEMTLLGAAVFLVITWVRRMVR